MQRIFDLIFAGMAMLVLMPLLLPVMIILKLSGEGEVFFVQPRMGHSGRKFGLLKFATMLKNSPHMGTGTLTLKDDPRVLPFGKFLRASKLNELPQIFNILKGEMSIIGPRPQTQRCFDAFPDHSQAEIIKVRPGLSGVGSIVFRAENQMMADADNADRLYDQVIMPYKGQLEEWYVANQGIGLYFLLIFLTAWVVVFPRSRLHWRVLRGLPEVPDALVGYVGSR